MFWSHWWLTFHDLEFLEPGSNRDGPRELTVCLLNESLGGGDVVSLIGAVVIQVALIGLLFAQVLRRDKGPTS
jgi:hypothetical protein